MLWGSKKGDWVLGRKPNPELHPSQASGGDAWVFGMALVTGQALRRHGPADSDSPEFTEGCSVLGSIRGALPGLPLPLSRSPAPFAPLAYPWASPSLQPSAWLGVPRNRGPPSPHIVQELQRKKGRN